MNNIQLKTSLLGEFRDILVSVKCGFDISPDIECLGAFDRYVRECKDADIEQAFCSIVEMDSMVHQDEMVVLLEKAIKLLIV